MSVSDLFCSRCGTRNEGDSVFCRKCGASLAAAPPPPAPSVVPTPPPPAPVTPTYHAAPKRRNLLPIAAMGIIIILLLVVVLIEGIIMVMPRGSAQEVGATLSVLQGQAFVERGGQGDWIEAGEDFIVQAGDRVRVADASHALLTFLEDTTTEVRALTELKITGLEAVQGRRVVIRLNLETGEIWNRIAALPADSLHEVTTVAAKVVCHGSEYGMAVDGVGTTWLTGREGDVDVTGAGQTVKLGPGETLLVEVGSPPVSYRAVAVVPTPPVVESSSPVSYTLQSADLPTFLNQPLPSATPTNTPTATPTRRPATPTPLRPTATPTRRAQPTATTPVCPTNCPTFRINVPSGGPPYGLFGIEWDVLGGQVPSGYSYVLRFSQDKASWNRTPPLRWKDSQGQGELWTEGGHVKAEVHGPGPGLWYWQVCIVQSETGPSCCCGPTDPHPITHERDEGGCPDGHCW
jgi:hypothetical protein